MFLYKNNLTNNKAYNLIITSALVLVMSVIMSSIVGFYNINNIEKRTIETQKKFQAIDIALTKFLIENNRFPCPAPLDLTMDSESFGVENYILYTDGNKMCRSDPPSTFYLKKENTETSVYGAVPTLTLKLDNSYMIDGWGNKIIYIVPVVLASESSNIFGIGEYNVIKDILIENSNFSLMVNRNFIDNGEIFALMSHSSNTSGAYGANSTKSNSFSSLSGEELKNMPFTNSELNLDDDRFLKFTKTKLEFEELRNLEESGDLEPNCPATTVDYSFDNAVGIETCIPFDYTGTVQEFVVPEEVDMITVKLWGAAGGGQTRNPQDDGGGGGYSQGNLAVTLGQKLYLYVGGKGQLTKGGWNGGGGTSVDTLDRLDTAGGGGATDIRTSGTKGSTDWKSNLDDRIMVAGGGGGASASTSGTPDANGQDGGRGCGIDIHIENTKKLDRADYIRDLSHMGSLDINEKIITRYYNSGDFKNIINSSPSNIKGYYFTGGNTKIGQQQILSYIAFGGGQPIITKKGVIDGDRYCTEFKGGAACSGGGGYYSGGVTSGGSLESLESRRGSCLNAYTDCGRSFSGGGGGGGAGYVSTDFTNLKGDCGTWNSAGKAEICYVVKNNLDLEYKFSFPSAKYGELSYSKENCPYLISEPLKSDDYYTLSSFKDKDGEIIDNKAAIKCGKDGKWIDATSNTPEAKYEFFEKCIPLPKCDPPSTAGERFDEWEYDFEIVNLGVVRNLVGEYGNSTNLIPGDKKIQCIVDKEDNAEYYNIKESEDEETPTNP